MKVYVGILNIVLWLVFCTGLGAESREMVRLPSTWTDLPIWSPDGQLVSIVIPAPQIYKNGKASDFNLTELKSLARISTSKSPFPLYSRETGISLQDASKYEATVIIDAKTYEQKHPLFPGRLFQQVWSPDGRLLLGYFAHSEKYIVLRASDGEVLLDVPEYGAFSHTRKSIWSPDSTRCAFVVNNSVQIWNVYEKKLSITLLATLSKVDYLSWSPDGNYLSLIEYGQDGRGQVSVYAVDSGKLIFKSDSEFGVSCAGWSINGGIFAYSDNELHLLEPISFKEKQVLHFAEKASKILFKWSPAEVKVAYWGDRQPLLCVHDLEKNTQIFSISCEKNGLQDIDWSPNARLILISDLHHRFAVCSVSDGHIVDAGILPFSERVKWTADSAGLAIFVNETQCVYLSTLRDGGGESIFVGDSVANPWRDQAVPRDLEGCCIEISKKMDKSDLKKFQKTSTSRIGKYDALVNAIVVYFGLDEDTPINRLLECQGISDLQTKAYTVLKYFHSRLNSNTH